MIGTYVYLLSRHDDNGLFATVFATLDELISDVIDTYSDDEYVIARPGAVSDISELSAWLDNIATRWGIELAIDEDMIVSVQPSAEGRNNLAGKVGVCAHHSSVHDGINIEVDAPTGTRVTVHLNDGELADTVVPA